MSHDEVNALGADLRIPRPELLDLIDELQRVHLITVTFAGLSLTPEGKQLAAKRDRTGTVDSRVPGT
ncbi:hypothetical protein NR798_32995 [Archangium gephyra]|uniref:hypothetical protein n=1 Tax=Archangium gephyra TaxID=48 RepID=UPI0035D43AB6